MRIQRLQTRIIVFFVALLALVQVAAFWFVNAANSRNAQTKVAEELNVGQRVFARLLDQNAEKLKLSARVLAARLRVSRSHRHARHRHHRLGARQSWRAHRRRRHGVRRSRGRRWSRTRCSSREAPRDRSNIRRCSSQAIAPRAPAWKYSTVARSSSWRCRCSRRCPSAGWSWDSRSTMRWRSDLRQLTELEVSFTLEAAPPGRRMLASTLERAATAGIAAAHAGAFRTASRAWS